MIPTLTIGGVGGAITPKVADRRFVLRLTRTMAQVQLPWYPRSFRNAIIAALSTGDVAGATDTAKSAIGDAYHCSKVSHHEESSHDSDAGRAIDKLEAEPESGARKEVLAEELKAVNFASDPELVSAARSVLPLIKALPHREKPRSRRQPV